MTSKHPDGRVKWGKSVTEKQYLEGLIAEGIPQRYFHLARVVALATLSDLNELPIALAAALDGNLSVAELREALVHLYTYAGFPRSIQGQNALMVLANEQDGADDYLGSEAGTKQVTKAKYQQGLVTLKQLTGRSWSEPSNYGKFAPRIDQFLKEHLFADVFADTTLSFADREVITVAILSALGEGVEPMLRGHSNIARQQGVSETDLKMIRKVKPN